MKTFWRSLAFAGILTVGNLGPVVAPAHAQAFGFGFASPGLSVGVASGGVGYPGVYPGYPLVAPAPIVVAPAPVIVPPPYVVARPYYGGYYGGYRGGYRPYPYHHYYRR